MLICAVDSFYLTNMTADTKELPPGQRQIKRLLRWGEDHPAFSREIPRVDLDKWILRIDGEVEEPVELDWAAFSKLPKVESTSDFHCVEGWSVTDLKWEGVRFTALAEAVKPKSTARAVTFECADNYTTSLTLEELSGDDVLLAYKLDGKPLEIGYGFPVRLIVPNKYAYKSALWVTRIKFTAQKELGYWEKRGFSDTADVWKDDRFKR